jgi:hypothetical protein
MAIKSSGQLALFGDIATEFGAPPVNIGLRAMSSLAGFAVPDAMSEFYGFSAIQNDWYFQTSRAWLEANNGSYGNLSLGTTMMGWFNITATSRKNNILFSTGGRTDNRRGSITAFYYGQFNRLVVELWDTGNVRRLRRQYPLHNSPNVGITGVTSSGTGWTRNQKGNTDSQGFVHLAFSINTSQNSYTGIRTYWNGEELTYSVNNVSSGIRLDNQVSNRHLAVANTAWNASTTSNFEGYIDNPTFFNYVVGSSVIRNIYQQGNIFGLDAADDVGTPRPYYAQGFESGGDLNAQVFNTSNKSQSILGSSYGWATYPNGYP